MLSLLGPLRQSSASLAAGDLSLPNYLTEAVLDGYKTHAPGALMRHYFYLIFFNVLDFEKNFLVHAFYAIVSSLHGSVSSIEYALCRGKLS